MGPARARSAKQLQARAARARIPPVRAGGPPASELTTAWLPDGVDDAKLRDELRDDYDIEVGSGLGELAGKGWRVGLMGHGAASVRSSHCWVH